MNQGTIEIARSYSRTIQLEQFTPTSIFMSAKAELDNNDLSNSKILSNELYDLCKETVDHDIKELVLEKERKKKIAEELS